MPSQPALSVFLKTRNPAPGPLAQTLAALRAQTLPVSEWEFVLVDNGSADPLAGRVDLSWHPGARFAHESRPGTDKAMECGLRETTGEVVICVDDDNVLAPDYLEKALEIAAKWPKLGVWGGQIKGIFESPMPGWLEPHAFHFAIFEFDTPVWSGFFDPRSAPAGAGMCIRRAVADAHLARVERNPGLSRFGRREDNAVSAEDQLLCYTAEMLGLGMGKFPSLVMRHIIPALRFDPDYVVKTIRGNAHATLLLQLTQWPTVRRHRHRLFWPVGKYVAGALFRRGMGGRVCRAIARGEIDALIEYRRWQKRDSRRENPMEKATA